MAEDFDIDPELLKEFLAESLEALAGLDTLFVELEQRPEDAAIVDRIFRPVHSIKGNSAFFGLVHVKNFSHALENILQEIRAHKRAASKPIIDVLLEGTDLLRGMLERIAGGDLSTEFRPDEEACLARFHEAMAAEEVSQATQVRAARTALQALRGADVPPALAAQIEAALALVEPLLSTLAPPEAAPGGEAGARYALGATDVTEAVATVVAFVREVGRVERDEQRCEAFLAAIRALAAAAATAGRSSAQEVLGGLQDNFQTIHASGIGFDELMAGLLQEQVDKLLPALDRPAAPVAAPAAAPDTAKSEPEKAEAGTEPQSEAKSEVGGKTLRVAEEKVDHFMSFVGELIIAGEVFAYLQKKLEKMPQVRQIAEEFKNANLSFSELSNNLQKSLMAVRRLPVRSILQKMPRIVRDIARANDKDVKLELEGEEIQIDKSLLEGLENPLVHMVRNSVDHGIEPSAEREAAGKPQQGTVRLLASATEETFMLCIADDGRGLDVEAIKAKAVEKGAITPERAATMSEQEGFQLIFGAGVSTAKTITEVSGRGVGMDVVRTNIQALGGSIEIESTPGTGTAISILLPMSVTLMVVDGLIARVAGDCYIIPLADVRESMRPTREQVYSVTGRGEIVDVRGELYRLLRLGHALGLERERLDPATATVVLVESNGNTCGILVDELLGQQSVVLKDLGRHFHGLHMIQGGAILGDGRVGLVLDIEGLFEFFLA